MGVFARREARAGTPARSRRSGPPDELTWWDPSDQAFVESALLKRTDLGKGWVPTPMWNNAERLDPYGEDPDAEVLRSVRSARVLTALDEGSAWRHRRDGALVVLRCEVFADADEGSEAAHRAAWRAHGTGCLDALWRERWRERDGDPGWIEARWRQEPDRPSPFGPAGGTADPTRAAMVDWVVVEDQTDTDQTEVVTMYQHLTLWAGRAHATLIVRHDQRLEVDPHVATAAAALADRLVAFGG